LHGFSQEISGQTEYVGVAFVPFKSEYKLQPYCSQGDAVIKALGKSLDWKAGHRASGGNAVLNTTANSEQITLKSFIDKISTGDVCFVARNEGADLVWHPEKFLGS